MQFFNGGYLQYIQWQTSGQEGGGSGKVLGHGRLATVSIQAASRDSACPTAALAAIYRLPVDISATSITFLLANVTQGIPSAFPTPKRGGEQIPFLAVP